MGLALFTFRRARKTVAGRPPTKVLEYAPAATVKLLDDPVKRAMQLQRYGFVVAQQERASDQPAYRLLHAAAAKAIDESFALVPEGFVAIPQAINDEPGCEELDVQTNAFLLARHAVTNANYQMFVDGG